MCEDLTEGLTIRGAQAAGRIEKRGVHEPRDVRKASLAERTVSIEGTGEDHEDE